MAEQVRESGADPGSARRWALRLAGLFAASDNGMDRFARLGSRLLNGPVAFVSLAGDDQELLPGPVGLPDPWAESRALHCRCRLRPAGT